jgi:hypothetical protein
MISIYRLLTYLGDRQMAITHINPQLLHDLSSHVRERFKDRSDRILGSDLGVVVQNFPSVPEYKKDGHNLSWFVANYLSDTLELTDERSGADLIFRLLESKQHETQLEAIVESENAIPANCVDQPSQQPHANDRRHQTTPLQPSPWLWKALVGINGTFCLVFDPQTNELRSTPSYEARSSVTLKIIELEPAFFDDLRREFVESHFATEPIETNLLSDSTTSYPKWCEAVKNKDPKLIRTWSELRRNRVMEAAKTLLSRISESREIVNSCMADLIASQHCANQKNREAQEKQIALQTSELQSVKAALDKDPPTQASATVSSGIINLLLSRMTNEQKAAITSDCKLILSALAKD